LPQSADAAAKPDKDATPLPIARGSETILVVEDEADVRELTCEFLKVSGYSVLSARNGIEALELLTRFSVRIHLVLSDVIMPKMGGIELIEQLRAVRPDTKVLLMSGYSEYSSGTKDPAIAHLPILQKPFSRQSLIAKVRESLSAGSIEPISTLDGA
jgi:CheY-like chemotaxis protein